MQSELPEYPIPPNRRGRPKMDPWTEDARREEEERLRKELYDRRERAWNGTMERFNHHRETREKEIPLHEPKKIGDAVILRINPSGEGSVVLHVEPSTGQTDLAQMLSFLDKHAKRYLGQGRTVEISLTVP